MLSVSRLCSKGLSRPFASNFSLTSTRTLQNLIIKKPNNIPGILLQSSPINFTGQISGRLRQTGTIALRFSSVVNKKSNKIVGSWLLICSGMVFVAVALGIGSYYLIYETVLEVIQEILDKTYGK